MLPPKSVDGDAVRRLQKLLGFSERSRTASSAPTTEEVGQDVSAPSGLTITGDMDERTRNHLEREMGDRPGRPFTGGRSNESVARRRIAGRNRDHREVGRLAHAAHPAAREHLAADKARRDDVPFRPPGEVTIFPPPGRGDAIPAARRGDGSDKPE